MKNKGKENNLTSFRNYYEGNVSSLIIFARRFVSLEIAEDIIAISKSFNVNAQIVGRVEASETKKLTIKSVYGTFEY